MSLDILAVSRRRREPLELQLTAMIDIFSMIVIFLIMGTVMGASEIVIPKDLQPPFSRSKEGVETAPRLVITKDSVTLSAIDKSYPLDAFRSSSPALGDLRKRAKDYLRSLSKESKTSGEMINVIADKDAPYRDVFDVVRVMREVGFTSMLFVAIGEGKH